MVTRKQSQSGGKASQQPETHGESSVIDEFVIKLAQALQRRGKRAWKAKEASKAIEQAIAALPKSTLKTSIQANLSETSAKLLQHLKPQDEQIIPKKNQAKRAKPAPSAPTQQQKRQKPSRKSGCAISEAPTLLDSSLERAVTAILSNKTPKSYNNVAIAPLISRFPPPEGLIEWHLLRTKPAAAGAAEDGDWAAQIDSAEKALQICNALSTQAPSPEHALAVFEPALAQMLQAVEALEAATSTAGVEAQEAHDGAGSSNPKTSKTSIASGWERLKLLSNRAVLCMQLSAKEITIVNHADQDDNGTEADRNTRWWLSWNTRTSTEDNNEDAGISDAQRLRRQLHTRDLLDIARTACSVAVSLCTVARLRATGGGSLSVEALAAHAAHEMKILAPYAAEGQVAAAAEAVLEEINKTPDDAILFLALYMSAVEEGVEQGEYYFLRMLAARNANAAATSLGDAAIAARILSSVIAVAPPPVALEWLRDQPPSSVILQALESLQRGPQGLSTHLIYEAPERAVKALAAAAKAGGILAMPSSGAAEGEAGKESTPADDLLFFVSKEGDGGAFGRDWGSDGESDGSDDDDGDGGLIIDDLPDEGKSVPEEEDYSEDSEDE